MNARTKSAMGAVRIVDVDEVQFHGSTSSWARGRGREGGRLDSTPFSYRQVDFIACFYHELARA